MTAVDQIPLKTRRLRALLASACWAYLAIVLISWLIIRIKGDRYWPATMMLFGPRWILLLPMLIFVPIAGLFRRRWLWLLAGIAVLVAWPIMGLNLSRRGLFPPDRQPGSIRLLTLNTHFIAVDPDRLKQLIDQTRPDIVVCQEWYVSNKPIVFSDPSWHTIQLPEAIIASPYPVHVKGSPMGESDVSAGVTYRFVVEMPDRNIVLYHVHLSSPHLAFSNVLHHSPFGVTRLIYNSLNRRKQAMDLLHASDADTLLAGDFNLPSDSTIFRESLSHFTDAFTAAGLGWGWTYYSQWTEVKIDHILMGANWQCDHCWVGPNVGSPHRPVIADLRRVR